MGAGIGMGMGLGMGQMFANMSQNMNHSQQAAPAAQQGGRHCIHCGAQLSPNAKFCPECGKPAASENLCPKCGAKLPASGKFCPECGAKIR